LFRESLTLAVDAVPAHIDSTQVRDYLGKLPGVAQVHDLHIWAMSTTETALTAHLVMPELRGSADSFLVQTAASLHERFDIQHATLQIENSLEQWPCGVDCDPVVMVPLP